MMYWKFANGNKDAEWKFEAKEKELRFGHTCLKLVFGLAQRRKALIVWRPQHIGLNQVARDVS